MHKKLMSKQEALAAMHLGLKVRNINWDHPEHFGCAYSYIKEGEIWSANKDKFDYAEDVLRQSEWQSIESFKDIEHLPTGWYIYEL